MTDGDKLESVRLDEAAAKRIIERATELDARHATESTVAQLRDAARDAGISDEAFTRALAEVRDAPAVTAPPRAPSAMPAKRAVVLTLAVLLAIGAIFAGMRLAVGPSDERAAPAAPADRSIATPTEAPPDPAPYSKKNRAKTTTKTKTTTPVPPPQGD